MLNHRRNFCTEEERRSQLYASVWNTQNENVNEKILSNVQKSHFYLLAPFHYAYLSFTSQAWSTRSPVTIPRYFLSLTWLIKTGQTLTRLSSFFLLFWSFFLRSPNYARSSCKSYGWASARRKQRFMIIIGAVASKEKKNWMSTWRCIWVKSSREERDEELCCENFEFFHLHLTWSRKTERCEWSHDVQTNRRTEIMNL